MKQTLKRANRQELRDIAKIGKHQKKINNRIDKEFKDFLSDFNNGAISLDADDKMIIPGFEYELNEPPRPVEPVVKEKNKRPNNLIEAKNDFLDAVADDNCVCVLCGRKIVARKQCSIDHGRARINGGTDDRDNLYPAHMTCNTLKGPNNLTVIEFYYETEMIEILELNFRDTYDAKHSLTFNFDIKSGSVTIDEKIENRYGKVVGAVLKYDDKYNLLGQRKIKPFVNQRCYKQKTMRDIGRVR